MHKAEIDEALADLTAIVAAANKKDQETKRLERKLSRLASKVGWCMFFRRFKSQTFRQAFQNRRIGNANRF